MQIKPAPTPEQSDVLKAAKRSNQMTIALFAVGSGLAIAWSFVPEKHKDTAIALGGIALGGGATAIRFYNQAIEDGRLDIGDLDPAIISRVLLSKVETRRIEAVKDFIEGNVDIADLPVVRQAIAAQMPEVMHQKVAELAFRQWKPRVDVSRAVEEAEMHQKVTELALEQGLISPPKKIVVSNPQDAI